MAAKTHIQRWLEKQGWVLATPDPLTYTKGTVTLTLSRFAITAATSNDGPVPPDILSALAPIARAYIPITLW